MMGWTRHNLPPCGVASPKFWIDVCCCDELWCRLALYCTVAPEPEMWPFMTSRGSHPVSMVHSVMCGHQVVPSLGGSCRQQHEAKPPCQWVVSRICQHDGDLPARFKSYHLIQHQGFRCRGFETEMDSNTVTFSSYFFINCELNYQRLVQL